MSKFRFDLVKKRLERERVRTLDTMAKTAIAHYKIETFMQKAWDGVAWKPRKDNKPHPLLQKTGKMRLAIMELRRTTYSRTVGVHSAIKYAKYHNSGTPRMPKRQFIGMDRGLRMKFSNIIGRFGSQMKMSHLAVMSTRINRLMK